MISIKRCCIIILLAITVMGAFCSCSDDSDKPEWKTPSGFQSTDITTDWTLTYDDILSRLAGRRVTEDVDYIFLEPSADDTRSMIGYGFTGGTLSCVDFLAPESDIDQARFNAIIKGYTEIGNLTRYCTVYKNTGSGTLLKIIHDTSVAEPYYEFYWAPGPQVD